MTWVSTIGPFWVRALMMGTVSLVVAAVAFGLQGRVGQGTNSNIVVFLTILFATLGLVLIAVALIAKRRTTGPPGS